MRLNPQKRKLLLPLLTSAALLMAGCMSDDYDSSEIDATMGFGTDSLQLPTNSTAEIPLADIIDPDANGGNGLDTLTNGDFVFRQIGDDVADVHPEIKQIHVTDNGSKAQNIYFAQSSSAKSHKARRANAALLTAKGSVQVLDYQGERPEEVLQLKYATVTTKITLTIDPTALKNNIDKFATMDIYMPEYMSFSNISFSTVQGTVSGNHIAFTNISTQSAFTFTATLDKFDFEKKNMSYGSLTMTQDSVYAKGDVYVVATVNEVKSYNGLYDNPITSRMDYSEFLITGARGRFCPTIELNDLGDVFVTNIPDILVDDNGKAGVYLDNPQVAVTLTSDMNVPATVNGTLVGIYNDGQANAVIPVNGMRLKGSGDTKICLCKTSDGIDASKYDQVIAVPTLNILTDDIPDEIKFSATATADGNTECEFLLGHTYTVKPKYMVEAPLAFAANAQIVYRDTLNDWHSDIEDMEIDDNSDIGLTLTATVVNRVPVNLSVSAYAIDENGRKIDDVVVNVDGDIDGSDGTTATTSPIKIEIVQAKKGGINKIDGIVFSATGTSDSTIKGITLNSRNHSLQINDIVVKLKGKYVGDFN